MISPALTVGAACADPRVQDGSHVVEFRGTAGWWRQIKCWRGHGEAHGFDRGWLGESWGEWGDGRLEIPAACLAARLVPLAEADRSPVDRP